MSNPLSPDPRPLTLLGSSFLPLHDILYFIKKIFFWPHLVACGILVCFPGMEPAPLAVDAQS